MLKNNNNINNNTNLWEIITTQYNFAKSFDWFLLNWIYERLIGAYERAYFLIEESVETVRACDTRKSWEIEYKPTNEKNVKEEIIDILKFNLNWIIDLVVNENTKEEEITSLVIKEIKEYFKIKKEDFDLIDLLFEVVSNFKAEKIIFPSINSRVREKATLQLCRNIIEITSKFKKYDIDSIVKLKEWDKNNLKIKEEIRKALNLYLEIFEKVIMLWSVWTIFSIDEDSFEFSEVQLKVYFDAKSQKNIKRQKILAEKYAEQNT